MASPRPNDTRPVNTDAETRRPDPYRNCLSENGVCTHDLARGVLVTELLEHDGDIDTEKWFVGYTAVSSFWLSWYESRRGRGAAST